MLDMTDENERRKAQENLDRLIQEGLDSGPSTLMMAQDWNDIRRESRRRSFNRRQPAPPALSGLDKPGEAEEQN